MKIGFASSPLSHELVVTITNNPLSATLCGLDGIFSTLTWPRNSRYSASKPYVHGLLSFPLLSLFRFRFAKSTISAGAYSRLLVSNTLAIIRDARARINSLFSRVLDLDRAGFIYIVSFFKRHQLFCARINRYYSTLLSSKKELVSLRFFDFSYDRD